MGSTVKIVAAEGNYLSLCEVKVFTDPLLSDTENLVNLAYKKPTRQSSTGSNISNISCFDINSCHSHRMQTKMKGSMMFEKVTNYDNLPPILFQRSTESPVEL